MKKKNKKIGERGSQIKERVGNSTSTTAATPTAGNGFSSGKCCVSPHLVAAPWAPRNLLPSLPDDVHPQHFLSLFLKIFSDKIFFFFFFCFQCFGKLTLYHGTLFVGDNQMQLSTDKRASVLPPDSLISLVAPRVHWVFRSSLVVHHAGSLGLSSRIIPAHPVCPRSHLPI